METGERIKSVGSGEEARALERVTTKTLLI